MSSLLTCYDKSHLLQMENISSLFTGLEGQFADPFMISLTNQMWFSAVCTLVDNDIRHHSGQNVVRLVSPL